MQRLTNTANSHELQPILPVQHYINLFIDSILTQLQYDSVLNDYHIGSNPYSQPYLPMLLYPTLATRYRLQ